MYLVKTPAFIQNLFPNFTWKIPDCDQRIYLTFDDGPIPEVTPWVMDQLDKFNALATFFCVGTNVKQNHSLFEELKAAGHSVGNHTFTHLNGWTAEDIPYFHNVRHCAKLVDSVLFRPPYGRMRPRQFQFLQRHYRIVMWDVLSGDFDPNISEERCLSNVLDNVEAGSIVVLHDSLKAEKKLRYVLPRLLDQLSTQGFSFEKLKDQSEQNNTILRHTA